MILRLTVAELETTEIKNDDLYWFDIYVNEYHRISVNSDREDLTIRIADYPAVIDFPSLQRAEGINVDEFIAWKNKIIEQAC